MKEEGELKALREYAQTLQRENSAKSLEQQTLYRELEALQSEYIKMEQYYYENRMLKQKNQLLQNMLSEQ